MEKLWNGNFNLGDFVTIICKAPYRRCEGSWCPKVKRNLGIITKICDYTSCEGFPCFEVKDEKGNEFSYAENELIPASEVEIRRALRELLEGEVPDYDILKEYENDDEDDDDEDDNWDFSNYPYDPWDE